MSIEVILQNPMLLFSFIIFILFLLFITLFIAVLSGNLLAMKLLAKMGVAVFSRNIKKDYKLLNFVNKDGVAWINIPGVCYAPIMKFSEGKYKKYNFLSKRSKYGELYISENNSSKLLKSMSNESNLEVGDLTIIRGMPFGDVDNMRHSNFSLLRKCKNLDGFIEIAQKNVLKEYTVVGYFELQLGEKHIFEYRNRSEFLDLLTKYREDSNILMNKDRDIIILQCKTDIDTVLVILQEVNKKVGI